MMRHRETAMVAEAVDDMQEHVEMLLKADALKERVRSGGERVAGCYSLAAQSERLGAVIERLLHDAAAQRLSLRKAIG